ncbi:MULTISPECIES: hypothetical protein [Cupriavidus]|uniref:hypothetical protein n=1 Tax=Cupriavidus TaxID=106589 RepID=UPI000A41003D|nr:MULTISPECIES: hypothetical protein [Cupriavidus]
MKTDEVYVDPKVAYASFRFTDGGDVLPKIRAAAESAVKACVAAGRTPKMVEVVIRVAP